MRLDTLGLEGVVPRRLPPGDGGLSLGQAVMARAAGVPSGEEE
jgi:hydrogenase maturation factor HypF (carbamoyltransferase family)